ncbi:MAG: hypothetical protein KDE69_06615 [Burkholderiaceae bacterium]|jgi:hypothetical protein|nr:hypothetical protein [Burkholderiaceae bacterium]MCB1988015.1 hypothetical protein [Burkholderiaceae bacterium]
MHPNPTTQLAALQSALAAHRQDTLSASALCEAARSQKTLLAALPTRYSDVLLDLLNRLESSALFTEESCSFSRSGLLDSLQVWADKAQAVLKNDKIL